MELKNKQCIPCEDKDRKPLPGEVVETLLHEVPDWNLAKDGLKISKEWQFKNFLKAMAFVDAVADIAESEGHHPDIHIYYSNVVLDLSTHSVGGLTENDFIVAAKIDGLRFV